MKLKIIFIILTLLICIGVYAEPLESTLTVVDVPGGTISVTSTLKNTQQNITIPFKATITYQRGLLPDIYTSEYTFNYLMLNSLMLKDYSCALDPSLIYIEGTFKFNSLPIVPKVVNNILTAPLGGYSLPAQESVMVTFDVKNK